MLDPIRDVHPNEPQMLEVLARAQVEAGQVESGINTLRRLADVAPRAAEVQYRLGMAQKQAGRQTDARRALSRALELDGTHADSLIALAELEQESGRYDAALAAARRLQALDEHRSRGYLVEGDIHRALEAHGQALDAYDSAYRSDPSTEIALRRFETARLVHDVTSAREKLAQRVSEYPDDHRARLMLASSYIETGHYARALPHYEVLVESVPRNAALMNNLAFLYQRQGDTRALALAREANQLRPDDPRVMDTLGMALLDFGDVAEGLSLIEAARAVMPDEPRFAYHHALALVRNERQAEAIDVLRKLLAKHEEFSDRADAEDLLERIH